MDKRDALFKFHKKIQGYTETSYFDEKSVNHVVDTFERFVNNLSNDKEILVAASKFANDAIVQEMMLELGITWPMSEKEAGERRLDVVALGVATMHRTLQQSFMRMVFTFIKMLALAYEANVYDARNEAACKMAHTMYQAVITANEQHLPLI